MRTGKETGKLEMPQGKCYISEVKESTQQENSVMVHLAFPISP